MQLLIYKPKTDEKDIGEYYKSELFIHTNKKKGLFNILYQIVRNIAIKSNKSVNIKDKH